MVNPIRDSLRYHTPFIGTLGGLNASAIILSFFGMRHEVCWMLQKLNHTSRAYILEQQGLPGFVQYFPPTVLEWLKDLKADGKLSEKLPKIEYLDIFLSTVSDLKGYKRDSYLKQFYPKLCVQFLQASGKH